jgi:hypothetical protein
MPGFRLFLLPLRLANIFVQRHAARFSRFARLRRRYFISSPTPLLEPAIDNAFQFAEAFVLPPPRRYFVFRPTRITLFRQSVAAIVYY